MFVLTASHSLALSHSAARVWGWTLHNKKTHCNALQRTATHCNALQRTASLYLSFPHRAAPAQHTCKTLQCTATHCNILQHTTICLSQGGTGLGLAMTKSIVESMRGTLKCISQGNNKVYLYISYIWYR